ncbi:MAG TPA: hypothetical protein VFR37_25790 [Longimicrobium sp.]|nr:hypothetical protein [Longimicrobium sp.]
MTRTIMRIRILLPALAAAALAAAPAHAQPFRSDVTGPIVTGSGIAGYPVVPVRDVEDALFRDVDGRTAFRSRAVADALLNAAAEGQRAACAGTLQPPPRWPDSVRLAPEAQRVVCGLLARGLDRERVLHVLREGQPGQPGDRAEKLVEALAGLGAVEPEFLDPRQEYVAGDRWKAAIRAYDEFIDHAPDSLMDDPPAELMVIAVILGSAVDAGLRASQR